MKISPQHNLSVKADVFPGSITPFILLTELHPFFLRKQEKTEIQFEHLENAYAIFIHLNNFQKTHA